MRSSMPRFVMLSLAGWLAITPLVHADESEFDLDSRFRAKIAKEKVKQGALLRKNLDNGSAGDDSANCGSQSIGNIDNSKGKPGSPAPREVFVFAPNAINLVSGSGCR